MDNNKYKTSEKIFKGIIVSILLVVLYLLLQAIVMIPFLLKANGDINAMDAESITKMTVLSTLISVFVITVWYVLKHGRKITKDDVEYLKRKVFTKSNVLIATFALLGVFFLANFIVEIANLLSPRMVEVYSDTMTKIIDGNVFLSIIMVVLLAPIGEEALLRGLILRRLDKYFSMWTVIIVQAILFSLMHLNPLQSIYTIPFGLLLGYVAYKSKSIIPGILLHALHNLCGCGLGELLPESLTTPPVSYFTSLVPCVVFLSLAFFLLKKRPKENIEMY